MTVPDDTSKKPSRARKGDFWKKWDKNAEEDKLKSSYVERAVKSYVENSFLKGFRIMWTKSYIVMFIFAVVIFVGVIGVGVVDQYIVRVPDFYAEKIYLTGLFGAVSLFLGGIFGGITQKKWAPYTGFGVSLVAGICAIIFIPSINHVFTSAVNTLFLVIYIVISSFSMFFIITNFHSSLSYRAVSLGKSPNRLFLQNILRLGAFVAVPMYGYLFFQETYDAWMLGGLGLVITIFLLTRLYNIPEIDQKNEFNQKQNKLIEGNYTQIIGFYNLYILVQVSNCYGADNEISNIIWDSTLLVINTLFMINTLSKKIENIGDIEEEQRKLLTYQKADPKWMRLKKQIGDRNLIFMALGLALGSQIMMIQFYEHYTLEFLGLPWIFPSLLVEGSGITLRVVYARIFVLFGLICVLITANSLKKSSFFRERLLNRFDLRHTLQLFGDLFRPNEDGVRQIEQFWEYKKTEIAENITQTVTGIGEKVVDAGKKTGTAFRNLMQKTFPNMRKRQSNDEPDSQN